jgi:hypothetical protein
MLKFKLLVLNSRFCFVVLCFVWGGLFFGFGGFGFLHKVVVLVWLFVFFGLFG